MREGWLAVMETEHFTFTALGETEAEAFAALRRAWRAHGKQYDAPDLMPAAEAVEYYGASAVHMPFGVGFRDGSAVTT